MKAAAIGTTKVGASWGPASVGVASVALVCIGGVEEPEGGVRYSEGAVPEEFDVRLLREGARGICGVW